MKFRSIKYFFEEAFTSVVRNRLMSVTSILTVASCIFILVFSYCLAANVDFVMEQFENSVGLSVIISDTATVEEIEALRVKIVEMDNVERVTYISAEEALNSFAERVGDTSGIIAGLKDDNPMPRSFTITLKNSRAQDKVIDELEGMVGNGLDKVLHARKTTSALITINNVIRIISIVIVLILGLLSVIIIMNTIKLTVNNRRADISIMKYVGATDWFIRWPFVIEGVIIGVAGAVVPILALSLSYGHIIGIVEEKMSSISGLFDFKSGIEIFPGLTPTMVVLGVFIGALGSVLSMRKYLDV